jgi:hypothetical protein
MLLLNDIKHCIHELFGLFVPNLCCVIVVWKKNSHQTISLSDL